MKDGLKILLALALLFWTAVLSLSCSNGMPTGSDIPLLPALSPPPELGTMPYAHERAPDNSLYGLQGKIESIENGLARGWVRSAREDRVEVFLACYRLTTPGGQWPNGQEIYDYKIKLIGRVGHGDYVQFVVRVPECYQCDIGRGDENVVVNKLWTQVLDGRFSNAGCVPERKPKLPPPPADPCPEGQVHNDQGQCFTPECEGEGACDQEQPTCEELGNCPPPPPPPTEPTCEELGNCPPPPCVTCECNPQLCPPPARCGDGTVNGTDQCEPPNTPTCDAQCQAIIIPPPPIQHGACVYEVAGRKSLKRAVCEGLGGTFDNHDGSDHCVFAFPGISNNQLNLAPGLSDADCLRKQN